jgi:hypothetical protein
MPLHGPLAERCMEGVDPGHFDPAHFDPGRFDPGSSNRQDTTL